MKRPRSDIDQEVAAIGGLTREELAERWTKVYGCPPPIGVRRELLAYAAAWNFQAKHLGSHSAQTRKAINVAVLRVEARSAQLQRSEAPAADRVQSDRSIDEAAPTSAHTSPRADRARTVPRPGARLIREWNGNTNVVDVVENGFRFNGEMYQSLSAIARKITGAHWSGPRFFGL